MAPLSVAVNTADEPQTGSAILTVTGSSTEAGDDGSAGRGSRVNGLIPPNRPMTMESVAGKNPISHVGKLYNVLALLAARDIVEQVPGVAEIQIYILSQIGQPLDEPLVASASVIATNGSLSASDQAEIEAILNQHLGDFSGLRAKILNMEVTPY